MTMNRQRRQTIGHDHGHIDPTGVGLCIFAQVLCRVCV